MKYLSSSHMRARGITDGLIQKFFPEPDKLGPNPRHPSFAPQKFYDLKRVLAVEATVAFTEAAAKAVQKQRGAQKALETKKTSTTSKARQAFVVNGLEGLTDAQLRKNARADYNRRWDEEIQEGTKAKATSASPKTFQARITVNYVRHQLSNYDQVLDQLAGKTGRNEARTLMKALVVAHLDELGYNQLVEDYRLDRYEPDACEIEPEHRVFLVPLDEHELQHPGDQDSELVGDLDEFDPDDDSQLDAERLNYEKGLKYL